MARQRTDRSGFCSFSLQFLRHNHCHSERREESAFAAALKQILRFAQNGRFFRFFNSDLKVAYEPVTDPRRTRSSGANRLREHGADAAIPVAIAARPTRI